MLIATVATTTVVITVSFVNPASTAATTTAGTITVPSTNTVANSRGSC